ncbi:hypothetical protein DBT_0131 [Dissulfuribacter thermophilus]|uniref:Uncharacterized protein n=1 Tax=Dissulfuribacter thermophilus TaxID=1156395 RepID=A0A1B9F8Y8_9BACT|nr:hypothetical protein [Dissulfuribacter thermophilus]OCC16314.1 hypothetical protein DBT_0131 [Dissulfuribacter thermophilus]
MSDFCGLDRVKYDFSINKTTILNREMSHAALNHTPDQFERRIPNAFSFLEQNEFVATTGN